MDSSLLSNIQKLFYERIEIFSKVEFSKLSIVTGIIKIFLKVSVCVCVTQWLLWKEKSSSVFSLATESVGSSQKTAWSFVPMPIPTSHFYQHWKAGNGRLGEGDIEATV